MLKLVILFIGDSVYKEWAATDINQTRRRATISVLEL